MHILLNTHFVFTFIDLENLSNIKENRTDNNLLGAHFTIVKLLHYTILLPTYLNMRH